MEAGGIKSPGSWIASAGVGVAVLVLGSLTWGQGMLGGKALVGAEIVLAGGVPYRDFWTMYAPGHFYLLATLFWIFGRQLLVATVATSVVCAITAALAHRLLLELSGRQWFAVGGVAVVAAAFFDSGYHRWFGSYPPALLLITLSLNLLLAYLRRPRASLLVIAGLVTGTAAVFKHDIGIYTAVAIGAGLLVHGALRGRSAVLPAIGWFGLGVAGPALLVAGAFALLAGPDMLQDLIVFPATDFRHSRSEYFPPLLPVDVYSPVPGRFALNLAYYLAFLLPTLAIVSVAVQGVGRALGRRAAEASLATVLTVAFAFHWTAAHVQINTHIISLSWYGVCAVALVLPTVAGPRGGRRSRWVAGVTVLLLLGWTSSIALRRAYMLRDRRGAEQATLELPKVSGTVVGAEQAAALTALWRYVQDRVPPGEPIFVGNHRHDMVVISDTLLYFVLDRPSATRYPELHPAINDTASVQREMIRDLRDGQTEVLVLKDIFGDESLEELKKRMRKHVPEVGATDLDRYIRENYVEKRRFGRYAVWVRRDRQPG